LKVDEGSKVTKDQVLAQLEDDDLRHTLDQLRTREALAKKEYERNSALFRQKAVSAEIFDRSKSDWLAATAATYATEAQLGYLKLLAPADGTIIRRDGEVGQLIAANQSVFWLSCCAPLRISAEVDEEDIADVQPGQKVLIKADAFPGKIMNGTVQAITPKGDPVARSYRVRIGFSVDAPLMIGMTAETNIITREVKNALLVPADAVQGNKLWVVRDGQLKHIPVSVGAKGATQTEIIEGVTNEDSIVSKPTSMLAEGAAPATHFVAQQQGQ
jgi:RND family efflux transporter MFP subunit